MFWIKILDGNLCSRYVPLLPILGLLCGFSHEGFAVGLSGGVLLYYCFHAKSFRGRILWLALPLFIATAIMVLSPGNIHRFMGDSTIQDTSISLRIANGVDNYLHLWFFWLLVLGAIAALLFDRKHLRKFVGRQIPLICIYTVSFLFSLIANTAPYSHTFTELISLLLILLYLRDLSLFVGNRVSTSVVACVIGVILLVHQFIVVRDNRRIFEYHKRIVAEYKASPDGLVCFDLPQISRLSEPFIRTWVNSTCGDPVMYFRMMSSVYFNGKKQALFLTPGDVEAITSPETFFIEKNKTKGTAPVYKKEGCDFYWVKPEEIRRDLKLEARYHPVDFSHDAPVLVKFMFVLRPGSYPEKEYVKVDTVHTRYGDSYRIDTPLIRRISEINVAE